MPSICPSSIKLPSIPPATVTNAKREGQETPAIGGIPFVVEEEGRARIVPQLSKEWFDIMRVNRSVKDKSSHGDA